MDLSLRLLRRRKKKMMTLTVVVANSLGLKMTMTE
jgi:hypothetical protein